MIDTSSRYIPDIIYSYCTYCACECFSFLFAISDYYYFVKIFWFSFQQNLGRALIGSILHCFIPYMTNNEDIGKLLAGAEIKFPIIVRCYFMRCSLYLNNCPCPGDSSGLTSCPTSRFIRSHVATA